MNGVRRKLETPSALAIALGVFVVLVLAWSAWGALSWLATPVALKTRLAGIDEAVRQVATIGRQAGDPGRYADHALCEAPLLEAAQTLQGQLVNVAAAARLTASSVTVIPPDPNGDSARPTPVSFKLEASGGYEAVLGLIRSLGQNEPEVFADTLDLTSQTSSVSIKLTGRVLCKPPVL